MYKFLNKNWLAVCLFLVFAATAGLFFADQVRAALTCSVASSCADVTLLKMSSTTNSHAGLPASSTYTNLVCCADVTAGLNNNCSGTYALVGTLSNTNNAHYEDWTKTNYSSANDFCLSVTSGTITVSTSTSCGADATLFSISGTSGTNAHVGDGTAYTTKICGTAAAAPIVSVSVSDGSIVYGVLGQNATSTKTLSDIQTITNTGNVAETFNVKGSTSTNWTLGATAGTNIYVHKFCTSTCATPPTNYTAALTLSYQTLKTNVASSSTTTLDLMINTPNPSTVFTQQNVDVTVQAVQYGI